ncbi:exosortase N [Rufibacter soli]
MNRSLFSLMHILQARRLSLALGLGYALVAAIFLKEYLLWDLPWLLSLALVPLVALPAQSLARDWPLFLGAAALADLAAYTQIATLYFFAMLLTGWWALQTLGGRNGLYPLLLLLIASPLFSYLADVWSFPLRLQLSQAAAHLLQFIYPKVEAAGNLILVEGKEFSVDPACAGLSMLSFSLLLAVFLMARLAQQNSLPGWAHGVLLLLMLGLNLACNLIRILLLVIFQIGPDQVMHEVVGLLCLLIYAVVPFYFGSRFMARFFQNSLKPEKATSPALPPRQWKLHVFLLLLLTGAGLRIMWKEVIPQPAAPLQVAGFQTQVLPDNVHKFTNAQALIYMKPVRGFYSTEHHPLICWEGSGYQFRKVRQVQVANRQVFMGTLVRGKDRLQTAWWMDNGQHQTIAQSDWRWRMFKGEPAFHLVNITTVSEPELRRQIVALFSGYSSATVPARTASW